MNKLDFFQELKNGLSLENILLFNTILTYLKRKLYDSLKKVKTIDQIKHPVMIKTLTKIQIKEIFF